MAKTRFYGTVAGLPVDLTREDVATGGTMPPDGEGGTTLPDGGGTTDPGTTDPGTLDGPRDPATGLLLHKYQPDNIFLADGVSPVYTNPYPKVSLLDVPAGSQTVIVCHALDGPDADDLPDPVELQNVLGFPDPFAAGPGRSIKDITLTGLGNAMMSGLNGGAYVLTDAGFFPSKPDNLRVAGSRAFKLKEGGVYTGGSGGLPSAKGFFPLGMNDPSSMFALFLNGGEFRDAKLPDNNAAVVRVTRCAAVVVKGPGKINNVQMPFLHDGEYNNIRGLRLEIVEVEINGAGAAAGKPAHPIYTQKELEELLVLRCLIGPANRDSNMIQVRGRQSLIKGTRFVMGDSTISRVASYKQNGLHEFCENVVEFGPGRLNMSPFELGGGDLALNHKGPQGYHIHHNVFDFRKANGNVPKLTGMMQLAKATSKAWVNWHDNEILL